MADYVYVLKNLSKTYQGGKTVLNDITLSFLKDAKIGIVGHNGAGKSTLLKIIAGLDTEFNGEAFAADGVKIGYLAQEPLLDYSLTVKENITLALKEVNDLVQKFNDLSMRFMEELSDDEMNTLLEEQAELQQEIDVRDGWNIEPRIEMAMEALRCPDGDLPIDNLSGGEKRRVALCKLLLEKPDILLLDEPTNHLDSESVAWLEKFLAKYEGMVLIVTHDRYFLDNVTSWILELDRGNGIPHQGNYSSWLEAKAKRLAQEEKEESSRQRAIKQELEWVNKSPKARQAKSKARVHAYEDLLAQSNKETYYKSQLFIPQGPKLGNNVINFKNVTKSFDDKLLYEDLSFMIPRGAIVGIIGPNGAGKTTLFNLISGKEQPNGGTVEVGDSVKLGYVDQSREDLDDNKTVWQEISDELDEIYFDSYSIKSRAYVSQFNFKGHDQQKKVASLSGGERNRVHMAKMLKQQANVLLLDEPTNDLDIETLRALENAILEFPGCVFVISHDRWFLNRIATHIIAFEGDSNVFVNEGNYVDYVELRKKELGEDFFKPKKIKYKPLSR